MKMFKYLFVFVLILSLGVSAWLYYPHYQMNKLKKQAVLNNKKSDNAHVTYINYFHHFDETQLNHLAIGDSVIHGVGAEKNQDLVSQFSKKLEQQVHKKIEFHNEGINGITSGELKKLVEDGQFNEEIKNADIITINVGGNDVLRLAKTRDFFRVIQKFDQIQTDFSKNLSSIAENIKKLNSNATIVFLELYNPLSPNDQVYSLADKLLPKWNVKIYEVANLCPSSMVIETTKVINGEKLQNLSPDGVHPNAKGYLAISEQMIYQFKHQYRNKAV